MANPAPQLYQSKHGVFYLRIRDQFSERRMSLKTCDIEHAYTILLLCRAMIKNMKINFDNIQKWTLKTDGENIEIKTEDNDADRASARAALVDFISAGYGKASTPAEIKLLSTVTIATALSEYKTFLSKSATALKTQKMGESVLNGLVNNLGAEFDMAQINDEIIETWWLEPRLEKVARTTCKRDLTFIRGFVNWAADKKRKYTPAPLAITLEASGENWAYLNQQDLSLIFDNLGKHAKEPFQLWMPIIGLYTGVHFA